MNKFEGKINPATSIRDNLGNTLESSGYDKHAFAKARQQKAPPKMMISKTNDSAFGVSLNSGSRAYYHDMFVKEALPVNTRAPP